ncbi:MAG: hypothetical protein IT335_09765 [Thermomicrobiales bacterium]|jgi:hypothetical protein|nr:hypothetical protein [Thermomicrobiales bacterium]
MKITVDLPEELLLEVKARAAEVNLAYKDAFADLLREGLASSDPEISQVPDRMQFPVFKGDHPAKPEEEMTPDRIKDILLQQEEDWCLGC